MFTHMELSGLSDFFTELRNRPRRGIYFYRINGCNQQITDFIKKYYDAARKRGVIIEGNIPNPDNNNLAYYNEMMGSAFRLDKTFFSQSLRKWLPRMNAYQNDSVSSAIYDTLTDLSRKGKNENMLKNAYIKFMCWLYYKFERIISQLGDDNVPKILYEGEISNYELLLIRILAGSGCDVVLLQYRGDSGYLRLDPKSEFSLALQQTCMTEFPQGFTLKKMREEMENEISRQRMYGPEPTIRNCTNAWIKGKGLDDLRTPVAARGSDPVLFYNCFIRINGVEDRITYPNELYTYQQEVRNSGRKIVIADGQLPPPSFEEISKIHKSNYTKLEQLVRDMSSNISYPHNIELQKQMVKVFTDAVLELSEKPDMNLNRLTNRAVYLLCWLKRYGNVLFQGWSMPNIASFVYLGGCQNEHEIMFLRMLARLPVDVLILVPDRNKKCLLEDKLLFELNFEESLTLTKYPQDASELRLGTVAYHAERDLDKALYQDSGIYRNQQYGRADAVVLKTMYEEVELLWREEPKFRPNFNVANGVVTVPVIYSKICGVKDRDVNNYWVGVKKLLTPDTLLYDHFPVISAGAHNPLKSAATDFFRNGRLQRNVIKQHKLYRYGVLREEAQEHILDKLQILINERFIRGTFENGTEYTIVATILNLDKTIVRLIQKFDFTKVNPKIICLSLDEESMTLEDTIFFTFLSLIGFDIAVFVPTGYQTIEKFYNSGKALFDEHQAGEYMYDLKVPNFSKISDRPNDHRSWVEKIFKRGK